VSGLFGAFIAEVALITYRSVNGTLKLPQDAPIRAPLPSNYTAAILVYGALGILPKSMSPLPAMIGWGFVVATFLNLYNPTAANASAASQATLAASLGTPPSSAAPK